MYEHSCGPAKSHIARSPDNEVTVDVPRGNYYFLSCTATPSSHLSEKLFGDVSTSFLLHANNNDSEPVDFSVV